MAQPELWEDTDYDSETDTDVKYDFGSSEDTDVEDSRRHLFDKQYRRRSNYEDFQTPVTRKRRKPLIEVEPKEPRKPIPTEEPRKTKEIDKDRRTKTKKEIDKREEDAEQFNDEAKKGEEEGDEAEDNDEEEAVESYGEANKDEEEGDKEEIGDEEEVVECYGEENKDEEEGDEEESDDEEAEEEDFEEDYGDEYIVRPEDLDTPYPKETMTEEEREKLLEEIATMLGGKDGPPDPDAFIPLDSTDGIEIGDERWNAMMDQLTKPHPYEDYMPKHDKTPAELIKEIWDRHDYNEGRYVDPDEFKDNDLSPPKDIDFEEITKIAKMMEEGKPIPDYYQ